MEGNLLHKQLNQATNDNNQSAIDANNNNTRRKLVAGNLKMNRILPLF